MGNSTKHKVGIVSGVGPLAGSDVFGKLLAYAATHYGAVEDCEYPDAILVSHGIIGVDNTATLSNAFEVEVADMVHWLEAQGATVIGIACRHRHFRDSRLACPAADLGLADGAGGSGGGRRADRLPAIHHPRA